MVFQVWTAKFQVWTAKFQVKNTQKLDVLTAQFGDVTSTVIEHKTRITKLEGDVAELQSNIH